VRGRCFKRSIFGRARGIAQRESGRNERSDRGLRFREELLLRDVISKRSARRAVFATVARDAGSSKFNRPWEYGS
jgi:hypothetical protein